MNFVTAVRSLIRHPGVKVSKFFITERVITLLTRVIDALIIYLVILDPTPYGGLKAYVYTTPLNIFLCVCVVYVLDVFSRNGYDLTGLEEYQEILHEKYHRKQYIKRFAQWILKRRGTIFWVGSWFYLDPDYVTLLLRDKGRGFWTNILWITVPSTVLAMAVWVPLWWCVVNAFLKGSEWAKWFLDL
ncbi:MAG: hypothetical protein AAB922_03465 [Patescibacteria group bacterium]